MLASSTQSSGYTWLAFAMMTVIAWGLYGVMLHVGVMAFDPKSDPTARYKAFLFVGIAYFITAVLAPLAILMIKGVSWEFMTNTKGITWSLIAGTVGAAGAFGVLLAFGAKGKPAVVMAIIFAGAPMVNAVVALAMHPPQGGWSSIDWRFYMGIAMAAAGGCLVSYFKPS